MRNTAGATTPQMLMETAWGFTRTAILNTAIELNLFTEIDDGHRTAASLAQAVSASERGMRILLNALTGLGVVEKSADQYALPEASRMFLSKRSPGYLGDFLLLVHQIMPAWDHLTETVRTGKPPRKIEGDDDRGEFFSELVSGLFTMNAPGAEAAAKSRVNGRRGLRILDIGAGSGVWGIKFAQQDPAARVTIVDFPKVIEVTRRFVAKHNLADRFEYVPGNFREVEFGTGQYDVAILGHICHSEGAHNTQKLLQKIRQALKPGASWSSRSSSPTRSASMPLSRSYLR